LKERALEKPRCRWEDNIKNVSLINRNGGGVDWIELAEGGGGGGGGGRGEWWAVANTVMNLRVPLSVGIFFFD